MPRFVLVALFVSRFASTAWAQNSTSKQIWGEVVLNHPRGNNLLYQLQFEPKWQVEGSGTWRSYNLTPVAEHSVKRWVDLVGETLFAATRQSDSQNSLEVTPRAGVRVHLISRLRTMLQRQGALGRAALADLARFEWRNFWYSDDTPSSHEWRFRNRVELTVGLNHKELSLDRTLYLATDFEVFVPLTGDPEETFASKRRTRAGLGYRRDDRWRFEVLFVRDAYRNSPGAAFETSANSIDFVLKAVS